MNYYNSTSLKDQETIIPQEKVTAVPSKGAGPSPSGGVRGSFSSLDSLQKQLRNGERKGVFNGSFEDTLLKQPRDQENKGRGESSPVTFDHDNISIYCAHCGHEKKVTLRCGHRSCGECRYQDYKRLTYRYGDFIKHRAEAGKIHKPPRKLKLLTLTLKNVPLGHLEEAVKRIRRNFKALLKRELPKSRSRREKLRKQGVKEGDLPARILYQDKWVGGMYAIEAPNKTGRSWHVHLHAIVEGEYIAQSTISEDWKSVTGGSFMVWINRAWSPAGALDYVLKYLTKAPTLRTRNNQVEYDLALKGLRMIHPFGTWYGKVREAIKSGEVKNPPAVSCPICGCTDWVSEFQLSEYDRWALEDSGGFTLLNERGPPPGEESQEKENLEREARQEQARTMVGRLF